jgi:hypothetical protein
MAKALDFKKTLVTVTAAAVLALGATGMASAADGAAQAPRNASAPVPGRHVRFALRHVGFSAAAETLHTTPSALLHTMRANQQTLGQIAVDQTDALVSVVVDAIRGALLNAHDSGRITDDQYDRAIRHMDEHLLDRVTNVVNSWVPRALLR